MFVDEDGFTLVTRKRKGKIPKKSGKVLNDFPGFDIYRDLSFDERMKAIAYQRKHIKDYYVEIEESILSSSISSGEEKLSFISYGIGSLKSKISQAQFAFALEFIERFTPDTVEIFDPTMDEIDMEICRHFEMTVLETNELGRRKVKDSEVTVFWMPHCPLGLYDNLIEANFTPIGLSKMIVLGNTFSAYPFQIMGLDFVSRAPFIYDILTETEISKFPSTKTHLLLPFGNLALHKWSHSSLSSIHSSSFWSKPRSKSRDTELS